MGLKPLAPGDAIRFVSGDASLTGTPRLLASLLAWLAEHAPTHPLQLLLDRPGPLLDEFEAHAEVRVLDPAEGPARSRPSPAASRASASRRPAVRCGPPA